MLYSNKNTIASSPPGPRLYSANPPQKKSCSTWNQLFLDSGPGPPSCSGGKCMHICSLKAKFNLLEPYRNYIQSRGHPTATLGKKRLIERVYQVLRAIHLVVGLPTDFCHLNLGQLTDTRGGHSAWTQHLTTSHRDRGGLNESITPEWIEVDCHVA